MKALILPLLLIIYSSASAQTIKLHSPCETSQIDLTDSTDQIRFEFSDSIPENSDCVTQRIIFKNLSRDTIFVNSAFTSDPFYICKYPRTTILPGSEFEIGICYYFANRMGHFNKVMGLEFYHRKRLYIYTHGIIK